MTAPATVPLVGKVNFRQTSKEALLQFWQEAERKTKVKINYQERVEEIVRDGSVFKVRSNRGQYVAHSVLLAIGRRGTPRKLGVPGEDPQSGLSAHRSGAVRRTEGAGGGRR
jgi:thioredoxin reductase